MAADITYRITGDASGFKAAMSEVESVTISTTGKVDQATRSVSNLGAKLSSLGSTMTIGITAPVLALGTAVVKTAADMEALKAGLAATTKESGPLEKQLDRLKEVAKLPGLGLKEAIQGSTNLQAAGFSANLAERSLKAFGNALATVGKGKADLDGVTLALSQIASKGKISAEEINQLAERVPQIRVAIKDAFGTADTEVLQKAGIGAEEFVTKVVAQLEKLKQVTGGTKNSFENLADSATQAAERVGLKLLPTINAAIPRIEKLVTTAADAVDTFTKWTPEAQNLTLTLGGIVIAAGPVISVISKVGSGIATMQGIAGAAGAAMAGLFSVTLVAAIAQTLSSIDKLNARYADLKDFQDRLKTGQQELIKGFDDNGKPLGGGAQISSGGLFDRPASAAKRLGIDISKVADELGIFGKKAKEAEPPLAKLGSTAEAVSKTLTVTSVGQLVYIESLQRMKAAVEKIKDVMFEYQMQGTETGKKLEYVNSVVQSYISSSGEMSTRLINNSNDFANLASRSDAYAESLKRLIAEQEKIVANDNVRAMSTETPLGFPKLPTTWTGQDSMKQLGIRSEAQIREDISRAEARLAEIKASNQAGGPGAATGNDVIKAQQHVADLYREITGEAKKYGDSQSKAMKQVSLVITDLSRGITDAIFSGKKLGDVFKSIAVDSAKAITRYLIEGSLKKLADSILGVGKTSGSVFGGIASALSGLFGGGSKGGSPIFSGVPGVTAVGLENGGLGAIGGIGGSAGSVGSSVGGAAASGITGIVGAVGSVVSAVSGVIGNFQMAGMNKSLDLIEHEVRYSQIHLLNTLNKANEYWPYMKTCWESLIRMEQRQMAVAEGGGGTVNVSMAGAYLMSDAQMGDFADRLARFLKARGL